MLFNAATVVALAALAQAAPWPANEGAPSSSTTLSTSVKTSSSSSAAPTTSCTTAGATVTKTISVCSTHASSKAGQPAPSQSAANLPAALAAQIAKQMKSEVTAVDKFVDLLAQDPTAVNKTLLKDQKEIEKRIVFDYNAAPAVGKGGRILVANQKNFPILTDLGIAGAVAFLNPCSMNSPHSHPRATELLTLVQGDKLETGMMLENGFNADPSKGKLTTQISATLSKYQATVFPQGSIHYQYNPTCEKVVFVAALSSSDPGTSQIAQNFFFQDEKIVNITLGEPKELNGKNVESFASQIPANLVQSIGACKARCAAQGIQI